MQFRVSPSRGTGGIGGDPPLPPNNLTDASLQISMSPPTTLPKNTVFEIFMQFLVILV